MSSETSTEAPPIPSDRPPAPDAGLQPWQLFTLAGLISAAIVAFLSGSKAPAVRVALILTVFAGAAIGVAMLRLLTPLTTRQRAEAPRVLGGRTRAALERDKALLLRSLKELEFDRAMGKVSEKDFADMSARLRARAARILRQLDAGSGYRAEIEREIQRRLTERGSAAPASAGATPVSTASTSRPAAESPAPEVEPVGAPPASVSTSRECAACATANDPDARFCKACGMRMEAA